MSVPIELLRDEYFSRLREIESELREFLISEYLQPGYSDKDVEDHVAGRSYFFTNSVLPWTNDYLPLDGATVLEVGPGTGTTTAPLGMAAKSVHAYDISKRSSDVARLRCERLGLSNVVIHLSDPEEQLDLIRSIHAEDQVDVVFMFAVLEHMKVAERVPMLQACWDALRPGGLIVIGDTPNRLSYHHGHTSCYPFFDMVPDELILQFREEYPNVGFADALSRMQQEGRSDEYVTDVIDRWGRGVSFHEIHAALRQREYHVVAEGLEQRILTAIPLAEREMLLMTFLARYMPGVSLGFARDALYLIIRKGGTGAPPPRWDVELLRRSLTAARP